LFFNLNAMFRVCSAGLTRAKTGVRQAGLVCMRSSHSWQAIAAILSIAGAALAQAQNCLTPPAGLVHWWRGEGNAFDTISIDDGTLLGGLRFAPGKVGTAFLISGGGDDYIRLPANIFPVPVSGEGHTPFSFEVWFETSAAGTILGQQDQLPFNTTLGGYVPAVYVGTKGVLYAQLFWGSDVPLASQGAVNDGLFHHAVVTYDGRLEALYLDGKLINRMPMVQEGYATNYYYQLGTAYTDGWDGAPGGWFPFQGVIDEPSIYSRALSAGEVATLFQAGAAGKCAPPGGVTLRHRYSFDGPPSSQVVYDSARNADGELVYASAGPPYTNGVPDGSAFSGNGALDLRGATGCVLLPPRLISVLSNFTIEAWFTWNGPSTSAWQRVFDFGLSDHGTNADSLGTNYVIFTAAQGGTQLPGFEETTLNPFGSSVDPQALVLSSPSPLPLGQEVYVAMVYDPLAGEARLYFNGSQVASATGDFNPTRRITDYTDWLGRSQWDRDPLFNGSLDEVRIWEGILTDQQIASHAAVGPNQQFVLSRPEIEVAAEEGQVVLSWPTAGNASYSLQSTAGLLHPAWTTVTNGISVWNGSYTLL
jgi:Concanavalin A-like lectin/glucanases superfamily